MAQLRAQTTVGVVTAGSALGIGAGLAYELARTGQLVDGVPVLRLGKRLRVPSASVLRALGLDVAVPA